jgi:hypothetical protein
MDVDSSDGGAMARAIPLSEVIHDTLGPAETARLPPQGGSSGE